MAQYTQSYPTLSEAAYNNLFRYGNRPGQPANPLQGNYQGVVDAANRAGIPPSLFASIMAQETGFGRYNANREGGGHLYLHNNPAGLMGGPNSTVPRHYDTFQEGLNAAAETAARIYQRGGTVLPTIQNIYAPTDPRPVNDPNNLNRFWLPNVTTFLRNIAGTMSAADYEALQPGLLAADFESLHPPEMRTGSPGFHFTNEGWVPGDLGENVGPGTGFTSPLPYAGTGLQGQSLQDWIASPTGGQQVAGLSAQSGYTLTPDVVEFVGRTAPDLGRGPEGFSEGNFPWFTPGRIAEDVGAVLQHHALMPNNLVFNPESLAWDVPQERRYPSNVGIWGAQRVADWLPTSSPGFEHDYLKHLGYGAPPAGNLFANPYGGPTFGMGNQGFGNIADMSTYGHTPFDYTQWYGALGNQGADFGQRFAGDPTAGTFPNEPAATFDERFGTWPGLNPATPVAGTSTSSTIDPGGPGYGAAQNPIFAGMYYSQVNPNIWSGPPTPQIFNSGIGPGGTQIASGVNTTPIMTYNMGPGGLPLAPGLS